MDNAGNLFVAQAGILLQGAEDGYVGRIKAFCIHTVQRFWNVAERAGCLTILSAKSAAEDYSAREPLRRAKQKIILQNAANLVKSSEF